MVLGFAQIWKLIFTAAAEMLKMSNRDRLLQLLHERAYRRGEFILSSGQKSDHYFDGRMVAMCPEGASLIGEVMYEHICGWGADAVGGPAVAAVPTVTSIVIAAWRHGNPAFEGFFVRSEAKTHGTGKKIEGKLEPGQKVIILDDTVTSGKSLFMAIDAVKEIGCEVVAVTAIVDRMSGATELFARHNLRYSPVYSSDEVARYGQT